MKLVICNGRGLVVETRVRPTLKQMSIKDYVITDTQLMPASGNIPLNYYISGIRAESITTLC